MAIVEAECFLCKEKGYHRFRVADKDYCLCNEHYAKYNDPTYKIRTYQDATLISAYTSICQRYADITGSLLRQRDACVKRIPPGHAIRTV